MGFNNNQHRDATVVVDGGGLGFPAAYGCGEVVVNYGTRKRKTEHELTSNNGWTDSKTNCDCELAGLTTGKTACGGGGFRFATALPQPLPPRMSLSSRRFSLPISFLRRARRRGGG
ncbi:hypothetical protein LXL04_029534 [Taraxacum kok-saghyz]